MIFIHIAFSIIWNYDQDIILKARIKKYIEMVKKKNNDLLNDESVNLLFNFCQKWFVIYQKWQITYQFLPLNDLFYLIYIKLSNVFTKIFSKI